MLLLILALLQSSEPGERPRLEPANYRLAVTLDFGQRTMQGTARLEVVNHDRRPANEVSLLLYRMLRVESVRDSQEHPLRFTQEVVGFEDFPRLQVNHIRVALVRPLPPGDSTTIVLGYAGYLAGYTETGMLYVRDRIDPAFTIIRPDAFAYPELGYPSIAANQGMLSRAFHYEIQVTVPDSLRVANGGQLIGVTRQGGLASYTYRDIRPAWRMDIAIAPYGELSDGRLRVFYLPGDSAGAARVLNALRGSMRLFRDWFGPLVGDSGFSIIEIPDGWGSQADRTSIIQAAAAFRDSSRINEVYHEVSHLWNVPATDSMPSRWNEGLATFLESAAAVALDSVGDDHLIANLTERTRSRYRQHPEYATIPMIDYGRRQMTGLSYVTGGIMFSLLDQVVGRETFGHMVGGFYREFQSGASTHDFATFLVAAGGPPVCALLRDWLLTVEGWQQLEAGLTAAALIDRYRGTTACRLAD
jgi:hypothetical protein